MTDTNWPRVFPGSPAFQSGQVRSTDGSITLKPEEFWTVDGPAGTDKAPLPDDVHGTATVTVDTKAKTATAAGTHAIAGATFDWSKTVPLARVKWQTSDGKAFTDHARAEARQKALDAGLNPKG